MWTGSVLGEDREYFHVSDFRRAPCSRDGARMRVVRNINNNVCICLDSRNNEVVVFGKGIGFVRPPQDLPLSRIDRTFYDVAPSEIELLQSIPEEVMSIAADAVDMANRLRGNQFSQNLVFTLADHISFTLKRYEQGIAVKLPLYYMTEQLYPEELAVGKLVLNAIEQQFGIRLPREEAAAIAVHLVNNEMPAKGTETLDKGELIERCTKAIEEKTGLAIDRDSFAYYRFVMHMHRLMHEGGGVPPRSGSAASTLSLMSQQYPEARACAETIASMLGEALDRTFGDDELLYLLLHVNVLCSRSAADDTPSPDEGADS